MRHEAKAGDAGNAFYPYCVCGWEGEGFSPFYMEAVAIAQVHVDEHSI